jgi:hypothetical protein
MNPERLAHPNAHTSAVHDRGIHLSAGFFGRPEAAIRQHGFHVLTRPACNRNLEIVNRGRAVHRKCSSKPPPHQVEQHGREAALDHMAAHSPDDLPARRTCCEQRFRHAAQLVGSQQARHRIDQAENSVHLPVRLAEVLESHLAAALVNRHGLQAG